MAEMAEKILKGFNDKKIMTATGRITVFAILLTVSMNTINKMEKLDGVKEKLDNFVNPIIESLSKNAKTVKKYFFILFLTCFFINSPHSKHFMIFKEKK